MSFGNSDFFFLGVNDEECARDLLHVFDAAQVLFQFFQFAFHQDDFLLRILVSGAFFKHFFQFFQTSDTGLNGTEIGEKDRSAGSCDFTQESVCFFYFLYSLLQVDDVDAVSFRENETCHFRIPTTGLMTKVNACFE